MCARPSWPWRRRPTRAACRRCPAKQQPAWGGQHEQRVASWRRASAADQARGGAAVAVSCWADERAPPVGLVVGGLFRIVSAVAASGPVCVLSASPVRLRAQALRQTGEDGRPGARREVARRLQLAAGLTSGLHRSAWWWAAFSAPPEILCCAAHTLGWATPPRPRKCKIWSVSRLRHCRAVAHHFLITSEHFTTCLRKKGKILLKS